MDAKVNNQRHIAPFAASNNARATKDMNSVSSAANCHAR
jgi:hypothetical protein